MRYVSDDGYWTVEPVRPVRDRGDRVYLRVRGGGWVVPDCATIADVARIVPLERLKPVADARYPSCLRLPVFADASR